MTLNFKTTLRKIICVISATFLTLCFVTNEARAYDPITTPEPYLGTKLSGTSIFVLVPHSTFGTTTIKHMNDAAYEWNKHLPSGVSGLYRDPTNRHSTSNYPTCDSNNRIYKVNTYSTDYVAQTTIWSLNGIVIEADMNINLYYSWANSAMAGHYDVWSVFLHEAGHIFGFRDIYDAEYSNRVMYAYASMGTTKRSVTAAESTLLKQLYS